MNDQRLKDLVLQLLETELGGVQIYNTALRCVENEDLQEEWEEYLEQTERHVEVARQACQALGIDPNEETPGRAVVRHIGQSLVSAMRMALQAGDAEGAQLVATECVTLAETKDHHNWSLVGQIVKNAPNAPEALVEAYREVEDEEDEHYYHSQGWCRELWIDGLGLDAVLPPPEEERDVKSQAEAAQAKKNRKKGGKG